LIFKTKSTFLLILITAFIGALVAGLGGLTASFLRTDN
jgi:CRISPR/Cas system-associated protein Cas5 (RAMP superfamily)